ncbi:TPA: LysM peptidoglycan-binding domain-containing protein [Streptococcus suis]
MPVQSRKVVALRQKRRRHFENIKRVQKTISKGMLMVSTLALSNSVLKTGPVKAQTVTNTSLNKTSFLTMISSQAKQIAAANDLYASVMVAQAVLESGWGSATLSQAPYYNLFGIKGTDASNSVTMKTLEDDGTGAYYATNEAFKTYDSYASSLQDYANLLTGNNGADAWRYQYYLGARVSQTTSYQDATAHLTGRYATDTAYATKLNAIIAQNNLTALDVLTTQSGDNNQAPALVSNRVTYTIQAGDTYWSLARQFGVSVTDLQKLNQAANGNLSVGQVISVPNTSSGATTKAPQAATTNLRSMTTSASSDSQTSGPNSYTVKAGDTYWALAKTYGVTVESLQALNGTNLIAGQTIKIPGSNTRSAGTLPSATNWQPPANSQAPLTSQKGTTYKVAAGDTLWSLAKTWGLSVDALLAANGGSAALYAGQTLNVPTSSSVGSPSQEVGATLESQTLAQSAQTSTSRLADEQSHYKVEAGDTLWSIANRYQTSVQTLLAANGLTSADQLAVGQVLTLTGGQVSQPTSNTQTQIDKASQSAPNTNVPSPTVTQAASQVSAVSGTYIVQAGDTLYSLAQRLGIDVQVLINANGGSSAIQVGQTIHY